MPLTIPAANLPGANVLTFKDCLDHATSFLGGGADRYNQDMVYQAVQAAYRDIFSGERDWQFLRVVRTLNTVASYSTGTVAYTHTGGSSERLVTLTTGTWPTWAAQGTLELSDVCYEVERRLTSSTITLRENSNPGADVASGTSFVIFQDQYHLPADFLRLHDPEHQSFAGMTWMPHDEFVCLRMRAATPSTPIYYTVARDPNYIGLWSLYLWPPPSEAKALQYSSAIAPRSMRVSGEHADDATTSLGVGTVSTSGTTVTGTSTAFKSLHEGAIIRFGVAPTAPPVYPPTGYYGRNPFQGQATVTAVASTTSLTIDATVGTLTGVRYVISDYCDLPESLHNLMLRGVERQLGRVAQLPGQANIEAGYRETYMQACAADRTSMRRRQGVPIGDAVDGARARVVTLS